MCEALKELMAPEIEVMMTEARDLGLQQGIEQGIERGIEQGIQQGIRQERANTEYERARAESALRELEILREKLAAYEAEK